MCGLRDAVVESPTELAGGANARQAALLD
jgi:hypothetical protein